MDIVIHKECGALSGRLVEGSKDSIRFACTKQRGHSGMHRVVIEWTDETDQLVLDIETGEVTK